MKTINVVGFDPSTSNFGCAQARIDIDRLTLDIVDLRLIQTESESKKGVIKASDDLRRAKIVRDGMLAACRDMVLAVSEIPFCNPAGYASANFNSGLVTGVLASCPIPLIQVFPADVKMAAIGYRQAAKEEMIEWGMNKYPAAPWLLRKLKGKMIPTAANEHLADAIAAIEAGLKTQQFQQAIAMYRSMAA